MDSVLPSDCDRSDGWSDSCSKGIYKFSPVIAIFKLKHNRTTHVRTCIWTLQQHVWVLQLRLTNVSRLLNYKHVHLQMNNFPELETVSTSSTMQTHKD